MSGLIRQVRRGTSALVLALAFLLQGCESATEPPVPIRFDAEVHRIVLEGPDAFVLRSLDSNDTYFPLNLPAQFQVEGARVRVDGLLIREYQVFLLPPVEIISISNI